MKKVRIAIVGCGMISNIYIRNLKHLFSIIDLVALCDAYQPSAEEKARLYGIDTVMTLDEIAQSKDIELVVNLTPPAHHYDVIKKMIHAGKHVFTEKMLTADFEQGRELVRLVDEKGCYLGVAPDVILGAGIQTARKLIDSGMIGQVVSCLASVTRNQSLNSEIYKFLRGNGGSLPYDVGIYYIAALLCLLGPVKEVKAFAMPAALHHAQLLFKEEESGSWQIPGNNVIAGALQFESGVIGSLLFDGNTACTEPGSITIYGTEGKLQLGDPNRFDGYVKLVKPEAGECHMPFSHGYNGAVVLPDPTPFEKTHGHRGVGVAEMAWAIRQNRKSRCSKEYGLHSMEVLCGMGEAASTGCVYQMQTTFTMAPMKSGYYSTLFDGTVRGDAERSLME